ncbi:alpha-N-arabinofuranosidase, partial [Enterococcus faecium]
MKQTVHLSELSLEGVFDFSEMSGFDTKATYLPKSEQVNPSHSTIVNAEDGKINCLLKPLSW